MPKNILVAPVIKWVGGKRQLLEEITPKLPKRITSHFLEVEPFCFLYSLKRLLSMTSMPI